MDFICRIFYTVLSLGILMIVLFPVVILIRFLLRNFEKKYTIWMWWLFFLRSICPVAISSAVCIIPMWNRKFHQILSLFGLTVHDNHGILRSWKSVFQNDISVTDTFQICSLIWIVGVAGVMIFAGFNVRKLKKELQSAKAIGDFIYESDVVSAPVRLGFLHGRLYVPTGFQTKEMTWLLPHMEIHAKEGWKRVLVLFVMAVHWFNPVMWLYHFIWRADMEMAADDKVVLGRGEADRKSYAQGLINFRKDGGVPVRNKGIWGGPFFVGMNEEHIGKRARRIMYPALTKSSDKLLAWMVLSLVVIFIFLLRPIQIAWAGGTWGKGDTPKKEEQLFEEKEAFVIAKMKTKSPEGLDWILQLEMLEGAEEEQGYLGNFVLKVYDLMENELVSRKVANLFLKPETEKIYFPKTLTLCISDYNGDGIQELVLGQQIETMEADALELTATTEPSTTPEDATEITEDASTESGEDKAESQSTEPGVSVEYASYSYILINIGNETLDVLCRDIVVTAEKSGLSESVPFEKIEGIDDIFVIPNRDNKVHYVWNDVAKTYDKRELTEEDLEAHRNNAESIESAGEVREHSLAKADGTEAVLLTAKLDSTQSESIQSVTLNPRGMPKKFDDVQGYFCDLKWLEDEEKERYAHLIYNGTKSQTFILYDTQTKNVYYRHEDGTEQLRKIFEQYRESDVTFEEGGAVIYDLTQKNADVLTINFAAEADGGVTIKGSYQYNVVKREASNLSFTRAVAEERNDT